MVFLLSVAGSASAQTIVGSAHDFSGSGWSGGEICAPCHTPHNAFSDLPGMPLWNHTTTTATYTLYSSPTMDSPVLPPGSMSLVCLSCHDGTVSVDAFGGGAGTFMIGTIDPRLDIETDLSDDHPIGIEWDHIPILGAPGSFCSNCHFIPPEDVLPFFGTTGDMRLECATCHDVHNTVGFPRLLRKTMVGSGLCMVCHYI